MDTPKIVTKILRLTTVQNLPMTMMNLKNHATAPHPTATLAISPHRTIQWFKAIPLPNDAETALPQTMVTKTFAPV
jgi:hypothetical protein